MYEQIGKFVVAVIVAHVAASIAVKVYKELQKD